MVTLPSILLLNLRLIRLLYLSRYSTDYSIAALTILSTSRYYAKTRPFAVPTLPLLAVRYSLAYLYIHSSVISRHPTYIYSLPPFSNLSTPSCVSLRYTHRTRNHLSKLQPVLALINARIDSRTHQEFGATLAGADTGKLFHRGGPYRRGAEDIEKTAEYSEKETDFGVADPFRESAVREPGWETVLAADLKAYHRRRETKR